MIIPSSPHRDDPPAGDAVPSAETSAHAHGGSPRPTVGDEALARAAGIFRAAGDVARLRLLELLSHGELCVSDIAERTRDELSTISQRLRVLRAEGLVSRRRDGKHIYYSLADAHVADLLGAVLAHACEAHPHHADEQELR
jgi:DNA-binding transcriptional ArsR family regulator